MTSSDSGDNPKPGEDDDSSLPPTHQPYGGQPGSPYGSNELRS